MGGMFFRPIDDPITALETAAVYVHHYGGSACDALHAVLPRGERGDILWRTAKAVLADLLPMDGALDEPPYWWRLEDREPRVLALLLAAQIGREPHAEGTEPK